MPAEEHRLLAALARTGVRTESIERIPVLETDEIAWLITPPAGEWLACWRSLRASVDQTGCWPLAITGWGMEPEPFSRHDMDIAEHDLDVDPRAIVARVPELDVDVILEREEARRADEWRPDPHLIEFELERTRQRLARSPSAGDVAAAVGSRPTHLEFERWLFEWELRSDPEAATTPTERSYLEWFEPDESVRLVLVPDPRPWAAWAYVGGYEWGWPHPDIRPAIAKRWNELFGAEPVANWGTMQQLVVARPPVEPSAAWQIAREANLLWPDTAGGANGIPTRDHARDLLGLERWFLHFRP